MTDDLVAAELARIGAELEAAALAFPAQGLDPARASYAAGTLHGNALKALAALDAVLKLADEKVADADEIDIPDDFHAHSAAEFLRDIADEFRSAVLAALKGENGG